MNSKAEHLLLQKKIKFLKETSEEKSIPVHFRNEINFFITSHVEKLLVYTPNDYILKRLDNFLLLVKTDTPFSFEMWERKRKIKDLINGKSL